MKKYYGIIILCLIIISIIKGEENKKINISEIPLSSELASFFTQATTGELDPYDVLAAVIEKGNKAVPGLEEFLFTELKPDSSGVQPSKIYAVLALDAIATKEANTVLFKAVKHPETEVRTEVVKVFAFNNYNRIAYNETEEVKPGKELKPDKEVLRVLIENADDTTYSTNTGLRIGEIAREGIKNWTGEDYGELPVAEQKLRATDGIEVSIKEHRKEWWAKNNLKVKWNADTKHFEVKE